MYECVSLRKLQGVSGSVVLIVCMCVRFYCRFFVFFFLYDAYYYNCFFSMMQRDWVFLSERRGQRELTGMVSISCVFFDSREAIEWC